MANSRFKLPSHAGRFHISRRQDMPIWEKIVVKAATILGAFIVFGLIGLALAPTQIGRFYTCFFEGTFISKTSLISVIGSVALLLVTGMSLLPAFKMKYWNLGGQGQIMMGTVGAFLVLKYLTPYVPNFLLLILMLLASCLLSAIWAVIPAIFKALFNTNESLFTLMMNYLATQIVSALVCVYRGTTKYVDPLNKDASSAFYHHGWLGENTTQSYLIWAGIAAVIVVLVAIYIKRSKHGYEISVIGGSQNTAKYIGINVKKVIIRTLIVSGIITGVAGFMIVGVNHNLSEGADKGYGFTSVLTLWSGSFDPYLSILYSFLYVFIQKGGVTAAGELDFSSSVADIMTAIFFILIIGSSFFQSYKISKTNKEESIVLEITHDELKKDLNASKEQKEENK